MRFCGKEVTLSPSEHKESSTSLSRSFLFKKVLCIIELFAGSYRNIYCRYIKKGLKKFGGKSESSYFCTRFSGERGSNGKKRDFFWRIRMKPLDLQSVFEWKKQAILEEITIDKKSSTRRVKVSVTSQQVVEKSKRNHTTKSLILAQDER